MEKLFLAIELERRYNTMDLMDIVKEFEFYTKQIVPKKAVDEFKFLGLNNLDFLTSNYLNSYGLKNLIQFEKQT
jgi:hypothetical protein